MSDPLFLLDPLPAGVVVVLDGPEGRHAATVRRIGVGERIMLADGRGRRRRGEVVDVGREMLHVRCEPIETVPEPHRRVVAVQALAKGERGDLAVELLTELGVDEIVPWTAARSIVQWRGERADRSLRRWRRTAQEAGKQSRRARFPVVTGAAGTGAVAERIATAGAAIVLHERAGAPLVDAVLGDSGEVIVVIGPEGGITDDELSAFEAAGATTVRLGDTVLRTSTAGGAALAALSGRLGRWQ